MDYFFFTLPNSTIVSPYYHSLKDMCHELMRKNIYKFNLFHGTHAEPIAIEEDTTYDEDRVAHDEE